MFEGVKRHSILVKNKKTLNHPATRGGATLARGDQATLLYQKIILYKQVKYTQLNLLIFLLKKKKFVSFDMHIYDLLKVIHFIDI